MLFFDRYKATAERPAKMPGTEAGNRSSHRVGDGRFLQESLRNRIRIRKEFGQISQTNQHPT